MVCNTKVSHNARWDSGVPCCEVAALALLSDHTLNAISVAGIAVTVCRFEFCQ
jgi:hypothetical protein